MTPEEMDELARTQNAGVGMAGHCVVCQSPSLAAIDHGIQKGYPAQFISRVLRERDNVSISPDSIRRHKQKGHTQ